MKRALQQRFILGVLTSFFVLMILTVGSIIMINYLQLERSSSQFIDMMLSADRNAPEPQSDYMIGYQFRPERFLLIFSIVETDEQGNMILLEQEHAQQSKDEIQTFIEHIISSGSMYGKIDEMKYGAIEKEDGGFRFVLLDQSMQMSALFSVIQTVLLVALGGFLALLIIVQPISSHLAASWVRREEQQKQFITNAGHELKTPVAIILSNVEAMELLSGENKYSQNIHQQADHLDKLIKQLLMIARADEMLYRKMYLQEVLLSDLIEEVTSSFDEPIAAKSMMLTENISRDLTLQGYPEMLRQMLFALVDNAVKYGKKGSSIQVTAYPTKKNVQLTISNQVEHLPDVAPKTLFRRFDRGDLWKAQKKPNGFGVGLSAVQVIVKLHRGHVDIDYPDQYTFQITIKLPADKL